MRTTIPVAFLLSGFAIAGAACDASEVAGEGEGEAAHEGEGEGSAHEGEGEGGAHEGEGEGGEGEGEGDPECSGACWRSAYYPADWTPGFTHSDGFLHDFSYAGYQYGEDPPVLSEDLFPVVADDTGTSDVTAAIQAALDDAETNGGGVAVLPAGLFKVEGLLSIASNVVLRGAGPTQTQVFFPQASGLSYASNITIAGSGSTNLEIALADDAAALDGTVKVTDAGDLAVGDDIAIGFVITDDYIADNDMAVTPFADEYKPIHRRTITAIDRTSTPHIITLDVPLREAALVRDSASVVRFPALVHDAGVEDIGLANAVDVDDAKAMDQVHILELRAAKDCWVKNVRTFAPPGQTDHLQSGGILVQDSKRITIAETRMEKAQNILERGNGYLFEVGRSNEVLIKDAVGNEGRHNFIQNWDFGTSGWVCLRCSSSGGQATNEVQIIGEVTITSYAEMHHSLARANLFDSCTFDDGWQSYNRGSESSGAGHAGTENVLWNVHGTGILKSYQRGLGYIIGTEDIDVKVTPDSVDNLRGLANNTEPTDVVEGEGDGDNLFPASLYEDQRARRLASE